MTGGEKDVFRLGERWVALLMFPLVAACGGARGAGTSAPSAAEALTPPIVIPAADVAAPVAWTVRTDTELRTLAGPVSAPRLFTALEVIGADSLGLRVRCTGCTTPAVGWVDEEAVIWEAETPEQAARGELGAFLFTLREAAQRRDWDTLRALMHPDFTFSLGLSGGRLEAFAAWQRERFRKLDRMVDLLERGVATADGTIWVAPDEYLADRAYKGLRTGFRRNRDGHWEWLFLVEGG